MYNRITGHPIGVYSDWHQRLPSTTATDECLSFGSFSFDYNKTKQVYESQVNYQATCSSQSNAVVGGSGKYERCGSGGAEVFYFQNETVWETNLHLCGDSCDDVEGRKNDEYIRREDDSSAANQIQFARIFGTLIFFFATFGFMT